MPGKRAVVVLLLALGARPGGLFAAFPEREWGARAAGVGLACVAGNVGAEAMFWNPALTAAGEAVEIASSWQRLNPGVPGLDEGTGYAAALTSMRQGALGAAATHYEARGLLRENTYLIGAAVRRRAVAAGINVKILAHDYQTPAGVLHKTSRAAVTFDAGLAAALTPRWAVGVGAKNLTEPDVGVETADRVPAAVQAGVAWRYLRGSQVEADVRYRNDRTGRRRNNGDVALGVEHRVAEVFGTTLYARAGVNRRVAAGGLGVRFPLGPSAARLDYVYLRQRGAGGIGGDRQEAGLSLLWGKPPPTR